MSATPNDPSTPNTPNTPNTPSTPDASYLVDGLRFAFGTLTVVPVRVTRWDREAARGGMLWAPLVGVAVGAAAALCGVVLLALGAGAPLAAVCSVAVPAALTRGLHLDGLADTADGLGSGKPAEDALQIMKRSDIGPFGVVTLVFVLLGQVAALAQAYGDSWARGALAAVVAATAGRLALTSAAPAPVPAAPAPRAPS
ncbi:Cobalamin synthase, partial [Actinobacteria bacterium OK074]